MRAVDRTDERGDVHRHALLLEQRQVLAERRPFDRVLDVALLGEQLLLHRRRERAHGEALAHDLQRHALAQLALSAAVDEQRLGRPRQHVDEAGRHGLARRVDLAPRAARRLRTHVGDAVTLDRDLARVARAAGSVVDRAATDQEIVFGFPFAGSEQRQQDEQQSTRAHRERFSYGFDTAGDYAPTCRRAVTLLGSRCGGTAHRNCRVLRPRADGRLRQHRPGHAAVAAQAPVVAGGRAHRARGERTGARARRGEPGPVRALPPQAVDLPARVAAAAEGGRPPAQPVGGRVEPRPRRMVRIARRAVRRHVDRALAGRLRQSHAHDARAHELPHARGHAEARPPAQAELADRRRRPRGEPRPRFAFREAGAARPLARPRQARRRAPRPGRLGDPRAGARRDADPGLRARHAGDRPAEAAERVRQHLVDRRLRGRADAAFGALARHAPSRRSRPGRTGTGRAADPSTCTAPAAPPTRAAGCPPRAASRAC